MSNLRQGMTAKTQVGDWSVTIEKRACGPFPWIGRISFASYGRESLWAWNDKGESCDPLDRGFDLAVPAEPQSDLKAIVAKAERDADAKPWPTKPYFWLGREAEHDDSRAIVASGSPLMMQAQRNARDRMYQRGLANG